MPTQYDSNKSVLSDGRQSEIAAHIQRGLGRLLRMLDIAHVTELKLGNGLRADLVGLTRSGEVWIIEIKSSLSDYRYDKKWQGYRDYCDRYFFAVANEDLLDQLPDDEGAIIADRFGAEIIRDAQHKPLEPARRKAMIIRFARHAAIKLHGIGDPEIY